MAIEIVSFPIKNGDFPSFFVCLPEGMWKNTPPLWIIFRTGHRWNTHGFSHLELIMIYVYMYVCVCVCAHIYDLYLQTITI